MRALFPDETQISVMANGSLFREYFFYPRGKGGLPAASRDRSTTFEPVVTLNNPSNERKIRGKGMPRKGYKYAGSLGQRHGVCSAPQPCRGTNH